MGVPSVFSETTRCEHLMTNQSGYEALRRGSDSEVSSRIICGYRAAIIDLSQQNDMKPCTHRFPYSTGPQQHWITTVHLDCDFPLDSGSIILHHSVSGHMPTFFHVPLFRHPTSSPRLRTGQSCATNVGMAVSPPAIASPPSAPLAPRPLFKFDRGRHKKRWKSESLEQKKHRIAAKTCFCWERF